MYILVKIAILIFSLFGQLQTRELEKLFIYLIFYPL